MQKTRQVAHVKFQHLKKKEIYWLSIFLFQMEIVFAKAMLDTFYSASYSLLNNFYSTFLNAIQDGGGHGAAALYGVDSQILRQGLRDSGALAHEPGQSRHRRAQQDAARGGQSAAGGAG
jgi:hypothetical protein